MYRNPSACEDVMQSRLAEVSPGNKLSITHSAVSYRGQRVVVEGQLAKPPVAASAASAVAVASAAVAASGASGAMAVSAASSTAVASAASSASSSSGALAPQGASAPLAASGAAVAAAASGASAAKAEPKPATPVAALAQKLGIKKPTFTQTAAECMFNESGLVSFRWLAPPAFAKTTPDPNASDDE
jgi:hypothetical protein